MLSTRSLILTGLDLAANYSANTTVTAEPVKENITGFIVATVLIIVLVFGVATCHWVRKERSRPAMKKKMIKKKKAKEKALEEKRIGEVSLEAVNRSEFIQNYKRRIKDNQIPIEFKALTRFDEGLPQQIAVLPCNQNKNIHQNVLPFDHCRVCLEAPPTQVDTDYINASFIYRMADKKTAKAYIAAQGPQANTIADFWRMIWQENISTIVMLTNVFSYSRQECEKYWHATYSMYGDIQVRMETSHQTSHYTIRHFTISKMGQAKERELKHFQFHTWIEQEVPDSAAILDFRRKVKHWTNTLKHKAPLLVHCGDGAGRTGAYITLDIVLDKLHDTSTVDVLSTIVLLRRYRPCMVSHINQLKLIYECICTKIECGNSVISAGEVVSLVQKYSSRDPLTRLTGFEQEYKALKSVVPKLSIGDCAGGHRVENRRKSRDIMIQPPERARPYLMTFDSSDSSDFINAVYVNGYNMLNEFIVTQWPLKNTVNDLWRLIFDAHVSSVVVLHEPYPSRSYPEFWPKKEGVKERKGPVCSTLIKTEHTPNLVIKTFNIKKVAYSDMVEHDELPPPKKVVYKHVTKHLREAGEALINPADMSSFGAETRPVQIIFMKSWPDSHKIPMNNHSLVELRELEDEFKEENAAKNTTSLIISKDGVSRAGVYCSLSICSEQLKYDREVDVFNSVKTVMQNRPQLIDSVSEYSYLYSFVSRQCEKLGYHDSLHLPELTVYTGQNQTFPRTNGSADYTSLLIKCKSNGVDKNERSNSQLSTRELINYKLKEVRPQTDMPNGKILDAPEPEFTDGKGFLHYTIPLAATAEGEGVVDETRSDISSFRMDSEIISLEDAEIANNALYRIV